MPPKKPEPARGRAKEKANAAPSSSRNPEKKSTKRKKSVDDDDDDESGDIAIKRAAKKNSVRSHPSGKYFGQAMLICSEIRKPKASSTLTLPIWQKQSGPRQKPGDVIRRAAPPG